MLVRGAAALWPVASDRFGSWATLRTALLRVVQGAMSAMLAPTLRPRAVRGCAAGVTAARASARIARGGGLARARSA